MLSKSQVVIARKQVEKMYIGRCTIIAYEDVKKDNGATKKDEVVKYDDIPCRLVYLNFAPTTDTETIGIVKQVIQLHLAPEIEVRPGTKIVVSQNDITTEYTASGEVAKMMTHQEVKLILFKGWS